MNFDLYSFLEAKKKELATTGKIVLKLKVKPSSKQTFLRDLRGDLETICIYIKSPAIHDQANEELIQFLADIFSVNKKMIEIKSGEKSSFKLVSILAN